MRDAAADILPPAADTLPQNRTDSITRPVYVCTSTGCGYDVIGGLPSFNNFRFYSRRDLRIADTDAAAIRFGISEKIDTAVP